jgi:hypothetical protein
MAGALLRTDDEALLRTLCEGVLLRVLLRMLGAGVLRTLLGAPCTFDLTLPRVPLLTELPLLPRVPLLTELPLTVPLLRLPPKLPWLLL